MVHPVLSDKVQQHTHQHLTHGCVLINITTDVAIGLLINHTSEKQTRRRLYVRP